MKRRVETYALGTFDDGKSSFAGVVAGERVVRIEPGRLGPGIETTRDILDAWATVHTELASLADEASAAAVPLSELRVLPPVEPRHIFQAGANYRTHVAEMIVTGKAEDDTRTDDELLAAATAMMDERARTGSAFFFAGMPSAMCGADDDVVLVPESSRTDWEAELVIVIGAVADKVDRKDALSFVAGYTVANDVSARDLQFPAEHRPLGGDWMRAKNRPTFLPVGPFIVPADVLPDYRDLEIEFRLNGDLMQHDRAANMLFDIPTLISQASHITPLLPGDLILTGSPAGNGGKWQRWLQPGDVMEASTTGIGTLRNIVRAPSPSTPSAQQHTPPRKDDQR
ncbi:2-keto-4-pentenoate hydratase/2-oxohepta-3-ene-1,7-dioic acid hydratase in catechol pathway [Rhodococcus erythropolis]|uniref:fumarylacetoacetate hydrolase family protein n=1 Tax=Rhodococcus erythropolis TaxID=1833 RepID=UPI0021693D32|nr:fumarylacetoacetate hydrolase family protein [Rhodococcus erythropolis]MCS4257823.1 2-keto-4-pentenoate hydratase/2-oxohepta-3-ene-1,7-dioic acid hydratase in catechol pathway [Rhodococcus erythropolis]